MSIPGRHTCVACGRAISALEHHAFQGTCDSARCRRPVFRRVREERKQAEQRYADRQARRREVAEAACAACLQDHGSNDSAVVPALVLPVQRRNLVLLAPERRQRFQQHVGGLALAIAVESAGPPGPGTGAEPGALREPFAGEPAAVLEAACAVCGGRCCLPGGDTAYITAAALRRYCQRRPSTNPAEAAAAYYDRLPEVAYEGSCVYHGASGCALPRDMRSDTCNGFVCEALDHVQKACLEGHDRLVLVSLDGEEPVRCRLVQVPPIHSR